MFKQTKTNKKASKSSLNKQFSQCTPKISPIKAVSRRSISVINSAPVQNHKTNDKTNKKNTNIIQKNTTKQAPPSHFSTQTQQFNTTRHVNSINNTNNNDIDANIHHNNKRLFFSKLFSRKPIPSSISSSDNAISSHPTPQTHPELFVMGRFKEHAAKDLIGAINPMVPDLDELYDENILKQKNLTLSHVVFNDICGTDDVKLLTPRQYVGILYWF